MGGSLSGVDVRRSRGGQLAEDGWRSVIQVKSSGELAAVCAYLGESAGLVGCGRKRGEQGEGSAQMEGKYEWNRQEVENWTVSKKGW